MMWSDEEEISDSDEDSLGAFERTMAARAAEVEAMEAEERAAEASRLRAQLEYNDAMAKFTRDTETMHACNIRRFARLRQALEYFERQTGLGNIDDWGVFARGKPKLIGGGDNWQVTRTREYLVGTHASIFQYAQLVDNNGVELDEMIPGSRPMPIHFDIEIKKEKEDALLAFDAETALKVVADVGSSEIVMAMAMAYSAVASTVFTEDECLAGMRVVTTFIKEFILRTTGESDPDLRVCST
jgi:hypothetical protein